MEPVIISGGSGLIGRALAQSLRAGGTPVTQLVRRPATGPHEIQWQPGERALDPDHVAGARAVVNLNGASIGRLPWTRAYQRQLRASRLDATRTLATALRALGPGAPAFLSASAVGFYGDAPGQQLTEQHSVGATFLARLCADWEHEARRAGPQVRVVHLRTAPLLYPEGVLKPLVSLTRLGVSGPLGRGTQVWPWISLTDEVRAIEHLISEPIEGPANLSGPAPATATEIGREIARRLHRPYLLPAPAWALRAGLGRDAADSLLLADARVVPEQLTRSGFTFEHETAAAAITAALSG
ncbi:TIGR01777 family oxidoreductase [Leucobacter sp. HY1910]